jgi:hypothetical protein
VAAESFFILMLHSDLRQGLLHFRGSFWGENLIPHINGSYGNAADSDPKYSPRCISNWYDGSGLIMPPP